MKMRVLTSIAGALMLMASTTGFHSGRQSAPASHLSDPLKAFLQSYLRAGNGFFDKTTRITAVDVQSEDGKGTLDIVYVSGQVWCGTGGCTMLIVEPTPQSFKVLGRITIVQLPIRLLSSMNYGYPDIGITVAGGGIQQGYEAIISFNGKKYSGNTSSHARRASSIQGKTIIADMGNSVPLYDDSE
jgi:hypothetical protein